MDNQLDLELLKINFDSYKKHSEWIAKGVLIYLAIVGTLFGIITKTEIRLTVIILYLVIIFASICLIYLGFLIKIWVKKIANSILKFQDSLNCKLDHLYYPAEKISDIIFILSTVILLAAISLLYNYVSK